MRTAFRSQFAFSLFVCSAVACSTGGINDPNSGQGGGSNSNGGSSSSNGGSTSPNGGTTQSSGGNGTSQGGGNASQGGSNTPGQGGGNSSNGGSGASGGSSTSTGGKTGASGGSTNGGSTNGGSTNGGGKSTSGGTTTASGGAAPQGGGTTTVTSGGTSNTCGAVNEAISTVSVTTPEGVKPGWRNYRVWGSVSLNVAPVYTVPLANCGTLICYTTGTGAGTSGTRRARVARLDANDQLVNTYDLGAYECRGLAAEPDGHFGALLWQPGTATNCNDYTANGRIYVTRYDNAGMAGWTTELTNTSTSGLGPNCPTDFGIGESRLEFGAGKYGAYYHVHSKSGHEGDSLKYVDTAGTEATTWSWGCSHSMSNLLRFNPTDAKFMPACVTDCYPGTGSGDFAAVSIGGVYLNNKTKVLDVDAGCNGSVAGELGGGAIAPSGWKIVFNAHQAPATMGDSSYSTSTMNQDIGFASIASGLTSGGVVWLTTTTGVNEADSAIERFKRACDTTEQYLVGWSEPGTAYKYKLARVSPTGTFIEQPVDVTAQVKWGRRDDPFRAHMNGDIVWAWFDAAASTNLKFARVKSGGTAQCAAF